ncbi:MAG: hypothetical protein C5B59_06670 [Bacteroidetes bacterium]|nr:MAG: hypothetical protein C5B59_06670 [Bacteroidota bacterium]
MKGLCYETIEISKIQDGVMTDYEVRNSPNSQRALIEAEQEGLLVVFPEPNQLQLDFDTEHQYNVYRELYPIIDKYYSIMEEQVTPSRSGLPHRHVTVTLGITLNNYQRIAIQACLGSDRVRELLSVIQEDNKDPHPTLFLEKKPAQLTEGEVPSELLLGE